MNTARIQSCANRIADNEKALCWLREYGKAIDGRGDEASAVVHLHCASAMPGAKEAGSVISAYAKLALPDLVASAIQSCVNTIEIDRAAIREELDREGGAE